MTDTAKIHTLKDGRFQLSYRLPYSQRRKRFKYESYEEAVEAQNLVEMRFRPHLFSAHSKSTVNELLDYHLRKCPHTKIFKGRKVMVVEFRKRFGHLPLSEITKAELEAWIYDVIEERNISKRTIKHWIGNLNWFFDFLVDEGILQVSPLRMIRLPSDSSIPIRRPRVILSEKEIALLVNQAKVSSTMFFYPLILTFAHTGARRKEILELQWRHVDFNLGTIHFRKTKNGADRLINIPRQLLDLLQRMPRRSSFVFTCEEGLPIGTSSLHWRLTKFQRMFPNGKQWNWHSFRHSFAHAFLKRGGEMYALQAILSHKNIQLTIDLYGQLQAVEVQNPSPYDF